jgi:hypothetical protein
VICRFVLRHGKSTSTTLVTYKRGQSKGSKSCSSIYTPGHHNNTLRYNQNLYTMSAEGQLHTAHAVVYQRTKAKQVLTTQDRRNGRPAYALQSPSAPLPRPRYADVRRLKGEELHKSHTAGIYAPRAEHRDSTLISQRILDWERESSDGSTVEDMQCSQTVSPIRTPADIPEQLVDIVAPSNELSPLSSPPDYQLPPPVFHFPVCEDEEPRCVKRSHSLEQRNTGENFTRMSPSSSLGYEDLGDHDVVYKDVNEGNLHSKSSKSCLIKDSIEMKRWSPITATWRRRAPKLYWSSTSHRIIKRSTSGSRYPKAHNRSGRMSYLLGREHYSGSRGVQHLITTTTSERGSTLVQRNKARSRTQS